MVTDGEENASSTSRAEFQRRIQEYQNRGNWTFTFSVPRGAKRHFVDMGIPDGNVQEWDTSNTREVVDVVTRGGIGGSSMYFGAVAQGRQAVQNFYVVGVDAKADKKLDKLSSVSAKVWKVEAESAIKDFVAAKTGNYVKGKAFYQLTKPETVQAYKQILIMKKNIPGADKAVYGGNDAVRNILGLPLGDTKVYPGNCGDWDIFVQSTSVNRKLVRGTRLIYTA